MLQKTIFKDLILFFAVEKPIRNKKTLKCKVRVDVINSRDKPSLLQELIKIIMIKSFYIVNRQFFFVKINVLKKKRRIIK